MESRVIELKEQVHTQMGSHPSEVAAASQDYMESKSPLESHLCARAFEGLSNQRLRKSLHLRVAALMAYLTLRYSLRLSQR